MNTNEIVRALRDGTETCAECQYYGEPCGCNRQDGECDAWDIGQAAADLIESLQSQLAKLENRIAAEGFPDLETMISKYKIVMLAANETSIETDEEIEALKAKLAESQRRERAAIDSIVREINQLMEMQMDNEEMYRQRGEKDMEEYAHAKYMGLHGAKCMIINNDWRGPKKDCKTCIYMGGTCAGMTADENFDCRNWRGPQAEEGEKL